MLKLIFIFLFIPGVINAQIFLGNPLHAPIPIELDKDTIYMFNLDKNYCIKDDYNLFGVKENARCSFHIGMPFLYIEHQFSLGCCTSDFYQIKVKDNDIFISVSDTGELCTCGLCTYSVCFYDPDPLKMMYKIHLDCLDTIVFKPTNINQVDHHEKDIQYRFTSKGIEVNYTGYFKNSIRVRIYNSLGQIIHNQRYSDSVFQIQLPDNNLYIMSIDNGSYIINTKLLKITG